MREEILFKWRIKWGGKWTTSAIHQTETDVRKEHPEATMIEGTRQVRQVPETSEEKAAAMFSNPTSGFLKTWTTPPETGKSPDPKVRG